ncbi:MAG: hypothetical protein J5771_07170 [Bacteroidales bacterium]|nr:hypothetical protein [Bacteroidales bacterium]
MKKLYFILVTLVLTSCSAGYQQLISIASPQVKINEGGGFAYYEEGIVVHYDFWSSGGKLSFVITNRGNKDIYVDLSRSFLVVNGFTHDYYKNRVFSRRTVTAVESSLALGGTNAFSTSNSYGAAFSSSLGNTNYASAFGSAAGTTTVSTMTQKYISTTAVNRGVDMVEKPGVWIPAHTSRFFSEFSLFNEPIRKCGFARDPSSEESVVMNFTEQTTPYEFENILMLVIDGQEHRIVNSFFIDKVKNMVREDTYEEKDGVKCDGTKSGETIRVYKYYSANRFFIDYDLEIGMSNDRNKEE